MQKKKKATNKAAHPKEPIGKATLSEQLAKFALKKAEFSQKLANLAKLYKKDVTVMKKVLLEGWNVNCEPSHTYLLNESYNADSLRPVVHCVELNQLIKMRKTSVCLQDFLSLYKTQEGDHGHSYDPQSLLGTRFSIRSHGYHADTRNLDMGLSSEDEDKLSQEESGSSEMELSEGEILSDEEVSEEMELSEGEILSDEEATSGIDLSEVDTIEDEAGASDNEHSESEKDISLDDEEFEGEIIVEEDISSSDEDMEIASLGVYSGMDVTSERNSDQEMISDNEGNARGQSGVDMVVDKCVDVIHDSDKDMVQDTGGSKDVFPDNNKLVIKNSRALRKEKRNTVPVPSKTDDSRQHVIRITHSDGSSLAGELQWNHSNMVSLRTEKTRPLSTTCKQIAESDHKASQDSSAGKAPDNQRESKVNGLPSAFGNDTNAEVRTSQGSHEGSAESDIDVEGDDDSDGGLIWDGLDQFFQAGKEHSRVNEGQMGPKEQTGAGSDITPSGNNIHPQTGSLLSSEHSDKNVHTPAIEKPQILDDSVDKFIAPIAERLRSRNRPLTIREEYERFMSAVQYNASSWPRPPHKKKRNIKHSGSVAKKTTTSSSGKVAKKTNKARSSSVAKKSTTVQSSVAKKGSSAASSQVAKKHTSAQSGQTARKSTTPLSMSPVNKSVADSAELPCGNSSLAQKGKSRQSTNRKGKQSTKGATTKSTVTLSGTLEIGKGQSDEGSGRQSSKSKPKVTLAQLLRGRKEQPTKSKRNPQASSQALPLSELISGKAKSITKERAISGPRKRSVRSRSPTTKLNQGRSKKKGSGPQRKGAGTQPTSDTTLIRPAGFNAMIPPQVQKSVTLPPYLNRSTNVKLTLMGIRNLTHLIKIKCIVRSVGEQSLYQCPYCGVVERTMSGSMARHFLQHASEFADDGLVKNSGNVMLYHCHHCDFVTHIEVCLIKHFCSKHGYPGLKLRDDYAQLEDGVLTFTDNKPSQNKDNPSPSNPLEINFINLQIQADFGCLYCNYQTKVRTNIVHHITTCHWSGLEVREGLKCGWVQCLYDHAIDLNLENATRFLYICTVCCMGSKNRQEAMHHSWNYHHNDGRFIYLCLNGCLTCSSSPNTILTHAKTCNAVRKKAALGDKLALRCSVALNVDFLKQIGPVDAEAVKTLFPERGQQSVEHPFLSQGTDSDFEPGQKRDFIRESLANSQVVRSFDLQHTGIRAGDFPSNEPWNLDTLVKVRSICNTLYKPVNIRGNQMFMYTHNVTDVIRTHLIAKKPTLVPVPIIMRTM